MTMTRKAIVSSDRTGRIILSGTKRGNKNVAGEVSVKRSVVALYPVEPTTIKESVLEKAITDAMKERLNYKK